MTYLDWGYVSNILGDDDKANYFNTELVSIKIESFRRNSILLSRNRSRVIA